MPHLARMLSTLLLLLAGLLPACGPFRGAAIPGSAEFDLGRVTHRARDGHWINLGSRHGMEPGALLWAWGATERPPFRTAPLARLRVDRVQQDRAHCRLVEGDGQALQHGWIVWAGGGAPIPAGSRLAVPAPTRLPDPTGWPTGPLAYDAGGGRLDLHGLAALAFEPLVRVSPHGLLPGAARRWSRGKEGRRWRFELRSDLTWTDGRPVTPQAALESLVESLRSGPPTLAGALLAEPPRLEANEILFTTREPVIDFPRLVAVPELALRSAAGSTGSYRLEVQRGAATGTGASGNPPPVPHLERRHTRAGPVRISLVPEDPTVNFYLGRVHLWQGIRSAAPITEYRLGTQGSEPGLRHRRTGELWVMLAVEPADLPWFEGLDREALLRTYLVDGEAVCELAELVTRTPLPPLTEAPATRTGTDTIPRPGAGPGEVGHRRLIVPRAMPEALNQLAERLQVLLIRAGHTVSLEHGDPRLSERSGAVMLLAIAPRADDPWLELWDLVQGLSWLEPMTAAALRAAIAGVAAAPDDTQLARVSRTIADNLGLVTIARVPLDLWLHESVETGHDHWRWPRLWVTPDTVHTYP